MFDTHREDRSCVCREQGGPSIHIPHQVNTLRPQTVKTGGEEEEGEEGPRTVCTLPRETPKKDHY